MDIVNVGCAPWDPCHLHLVDSFRVAQSYLARVQVTCTQWRHGQTFCVMTSIKRNYDAIKPATFLYLKRFVFQPLSRRVSVREPFTWVTVTSSKNDVINTWKKNKNKDSNMWNGRLTCFCRCWMTGGRRMRTSGSQTTKIEKHPIDGAIVRQD